VKSIIILRRRCLPRRASGICQEHSRGTPNAQVLRFAQDDKSLEVQPRHNLSVSHFADTQAMPSGPLPVAMRPVTVRLVKSNTATLSSELTAT